MRAPASSAVAERVRHLGHVPPETLPALYRAARRCVPEPYEGFGAPPCEAMACGCPGSGLRRLAVREVCGDAALLFDPPSRRDCGRPR